MRRKSFLAAVMAGVMLVTSVIVGADVTVQASEGVTNVSFTGKYGQTEARDMLALVNEFRSGSEAWYWNEDNTTKTVCSNLSGLVYDYDLEKAAMIRAAELAVSYSHTRPNGTECFTAFNWQYGCAENIAYGYRSAEAVFKAWREDDDMYKDQGHRRNMLSSNIKAIGIGHFVYDGYDFWVQDFRDNVVDENATAANDSETAVTVEAEESLAKKFMPDTAPTPEPVVTAAPTAEPTATPTAEPTATPTVAPTATPTAEPTATPTAEPTATPTAVPTAEPTAEPTATPTAVPTATPTAVPTATPTVAPTATPTAVPTATPTAAPTATPTAAPTATPTAVPTAAPTAAPAATPTAAPTATPTATPTAAPTVTATPTPVQTPEITIPEEPDEQPEILPAPEPVVTEAPENGNDIQKGDVIKDKKTSAEYVITTVGKNNTVQLAVYKKKAANVTIPNTIKIGGKTYKVTSIASSVFKNNTKLKSVTIGKNIKTIGKDAFKGCKKLKKITIKSTKLTAKSIGKNTFKGISEKATIKVPKNKVKLYKKLFREKGLSKKVKVTA